MATKSLKGATRAGRLLGLQRGSGTWLAVVQAISTARGSDPIVTRIQPVEELTGAPRRKAERWLETLA